MIQRLRNWYARTRPSSRRVLASFGAVAVAAAVFLVPNMTHAAGLGDALGDLIANIFGFFTTVLGFILLTFIKILISVAQYNNFVGPDAPAAVHTGWIVTRDLANMFFIVILIIISIGTILSIEQYHYSKHLRKLLIVAVAINFSKTICGIFIDMGQVFMLTFVNGFAQAAGGNFLRAFQIEKLLTLRETGNASGLGLAMGMFLAFVMVAISLAIVISITVMLVWRVVTLWVLIILAPLTWMTAAFPITAASKYYADWWEKFRTNIMAGPVLAFFLWLALLTVQSSDGNIADKTKMLKEADAGVNTEAAALQTGIPTEAAQSSSILSLIIVCAILLIGLDTAGRSGAVGAGIASSMKGRLQKAGAFAWRNTGGRAIGGAKATGKAALGVGLAVTGAGLSKVPGLRGVGTGLRVQGQRVRESQAEARKKLSETVFGSAVERAKADPRGFNRDMAAEKDMDMRARMAKAVMADEKAAARMAKDPKEAAKMIEYMDQARKEKPSLDSTYRAVLANNWEAGTEPLADTDANKAENKVRLARRQEAFKNFSKDDAAQVDGDFLAKGENKDLIAGASDAAVQQWLTEGTAEQKAGMMKYLNAMSQEPEGARKVKDYLTRKRVDATKIGANMIDPKAEGSNETLRTYVTDRAISNKDDKRVIMATPGVGDIVRQETRTRLDKELDKGPDEPSDVGKAAVEAVVSGAKKSSDFTSKEGLAELKKIVAKLNVPSLARAVPYDAPAEVRGAAQTMMAGYLAKQPPATYAKMQNQGQYAGIMPSEEEVEKMRKTFADAEAAEAGTVTATQGTTTTGTTSAPAAAAPPVDTQPAYQAANRRITQLENVLKQSGNQLQSQNQAEFDKLKSAMNALTKATDSRDAHQKNIRRAEDSGNQAQADKLTAELEDLNKNVARLTGDLEKQARG